MSGNSFSSMPAELRAERERWDRLAKDPYYSVINEDAYRGTSLSGQERKRFDRSGEEDVSRTLGDIRRWVDPDFHPGHGVDFGCGTGRLTIPFARVCDRITGVDISARMLDEARRNAAAHGVENAEFALTPDYLTDRSTNQARADFIHAYIVFQHIPPRAGLWLARSLIGRLTPGGIGALHFTFARRTSWIRRLSHRLRRVVPGMNVLANRVKHRPLGEPLIPMFEYDLAAVFTLLNDHGCETAHVRLTDHGGHLGAMLIFRRGCAEAR